MGSSRSHGQLSHQLVETVLHAQLASAHFLLPPESTTKNKTKTYE
jgi:hypothetical protein